MDKQNHIENNQNCRRRLKPASESGLTLIEVVVSVVILAGLLGVVLAIYFSCAESWRRGVTESRSQSLAWMALKRMAPDVRQAISVIPFPEPYDGYGITLQLPARAFDSSEQTYFNTLSVNAEGQPYLEKGNTVSYFRGTASGSPSVSGTKLWRVVSGTDGHEIKREAVLEGLVDNPAGEDGHPKPIFVYWPDIFRLHSLEATVTVLSQEASREAQTTITGETALRNR